MIFFDIDDTLLNYRTSQSKAALAFAKRHASHLRAPDRFENLWNEVTERHMARYLAGELSFQEQRRYRIFDCFTLSLSNDEADTLFGEYYQLYEASWSLFPEVNIALDQLTAHSLGVITNGDKENQIQKLKKLGILDYFCDVVTPACAGAAKPDEAIFTLAASRSGKPESHCWYIGDNYLADYQGAKNARFHAAWLNRAGLNAPCDKQCRDLTDFVHMLDSYKKSY